MENKAVFQELQMSFHIGLGLLTTEGIVSLEPLFYILSLFLIHFMMNLEGVLMMFNLPRFDRRADFSFVFQNKVDLSVVIFDSYAKGEN